MIGSAITYWIGRTAGEKGLERFVPEKRLDRVRQRVENSAPPAVAALALIPPPFPLTPFVLAAGAFGLDAWRFFASLAVFKAVRYGAASLLAVQFGTRITDWMETPAFKTTIGVFIVVIVAGTAVSGVKLWRSTRRAR